MIIRTLFILTLFLMLRHIGVAQSANMPLSNEYQRWVFSQMTTSETQLHTSMRPLLARELVNVVDTSNRFISPYVKNKTISGIMMFDSFLGRESNRWIGQLGTGVMVTANWNKKFSATSDVSALGGNYPTYYNRYIDSLTVFPGNGISHSSFIGKYVYQLNGYVSYSPNEIFNLQLGRGKHFIGDGYRSLLLSDFSNNYPYLKINTKIWKLQYTNLYAALKDIGNNSSFPNRQIQNKYFSAHYLNWNISKNLSLGLFETVVWGEKDSLNQRGFDYSYLNPVVYYRPIEYAAGSSDNVILGANGKLKLAKKYVVYGQLVLDEFLLENVKARNGWWANKYGGQIGVKGVDPLGIKDLYFQVEFNTVRPFTYSHGSSLQNYGHYNQPLAHPIGANFYEGLGIINYQLSERLEVEGKFLYLRKGEDSATENFGGDIYQSYINPVNQFGNFIGQGEAKKIAFGQLIVGYVVLPAWSIKVQGILTYRQEYFLNKNDNSTFFTIAINSNLKNRYSDF